ncbi:MAG: hypothetical protein ACPGWR_20205 [Ardenticatenaceae bacterium]
MKLDSLRGWQVANRISSDVRASLIIGQYKLDGGVIQTGEGGEVFGLLLPLYPPPLDLASTPVNTYELQQLSSQAGELAVTTEQVLQVATRTMRLSDLNLAITTLDLPAIHDKLKKFEGLEPIQEELKKISTWRERVERANLRVTIADLLNLDEQAMIEDRYSLLEQARRILAKINERAKPLLLKAQTIKSGMQMQEYFLLTGLALSCCTAELGRLEIAHRETKQIATIWQEQSRRIANDLLLGEHPERFLFSDLVSEVPTATLVEWLDFARGKKKGYLWLDDLRKQSRPWYPKGKIPLAPLKAQKNELKRDQTLIIPTMQKLVATNNVINGYVAQYAFLKEKKVKPSKLKREINSLAEKAAVDGYVILAPTTS